MSAAHRRRAHAPRPASSLAREPRALREAREDVDHLLNDLESSNPKQRERSTGRFLQVPWPWLADRTVGGVLATRNTIRRKHALRVVACENGHPDWPTFTDAVLGEVARREPRLYDCLWFDRNGAGAWGRALVRHRSAEDAVCAARDRLRGAPAPRCAVADWTPARLAWGVTRFVDQPYACWLGTAQFAIDTGESIFAVGQPRPFPRALYAVEFVRRPSPSDPDFPLALDVRRTGTGAADESDVLRSLDDVRLAVIRTASAEGARAAALDRVARGGGGFRAGTWDVAAVQSVPDALGVVGLSASYPLDVLPFWAPPRFGVA